MAATRAIRLALAATLLAAAGCLWTAWCEFPFYAWNDVRLAPAFALRHGINPYPLLGAGPLFTWIYGPVGVFVNLPATFADSTQAALHAASVINAVTVLGPVAVIFFASTELRARGLATCLFALTLAVLLTPRPNLVLQVADHSAIACGLLSCWLLAATPRPGTGRLAAAAGLAALAVWSKQIAVFLLLAQFIYLLRSVSAATALRYTAWVAFFGFAGLAVFSALFGFDNLWLNLVAIPGRLPWAEFWPRFTMRPWALVAQILLPAAGLFLLWRRGLWPDREQASGRFFQLSVLAAAAMLPIGLAGYFKIGGDTNLLHSWDYLLPGVLLAWLARERPGSRSAGLRLLAAVAAGLGVRAGELLTLPARPFTQHFAVAAQLQAEFPHVLWFPQHPVLTFYADGRLWHSEDGVLTRDVAGYGLREPDFRRHLPPGLQGVAYPAIVQFPFAMPLLSEFNRQVPYRHWTLHTRAPAPTASP